MKNYLILVISTVLTFLSVNSFGTDSVMSPPATTPMANCPKMILSGMQLSSLPQTSLLNGSGADCQFAVDNGTIVVGGFIGVITMAGVMHPSCPADHPYLAAFNEGWGVGAGIGAAVTNYTCCALPQMSATGDWANYTSSTSPSNDCP